jgi:hypothetical protein
MPTADRDHRRTAGDELLSNRDYGFPHDATGLVLVLTGYDRFAHEFPGIAYDLVDVFAVRSCDALRTGEQLICLIQSTGPRFSLPPVGATPVIWNRAEWLNASRGL